MEMKGPSHAGAFDPFTSPSGHTTQHNTTRHDTFFSIRDAGYPNSPDCQLASQRLVVDWGSGGVGARTKRNTHTHTHTHTQTHTHTHTHIHRRILAAAAAAAAGCGREKHDGWFARLPFIHTPSEDHDLAIYQSKRRRQSKGALFYASHGWCNVSETETKVVPSTWVWQECCEQDRLLQGTWWRASVSSTWV